MQERVRKKSSRASLIFWSWTNFYVLFWTLLAAQTIAVVCFFMPSWRVVRIGRYTLNLGIWSYCLHIETYNECSYFEHIQQAAQSRVLRGLQVVLSVCLVLGFKFTCMLFNSKRRMADSFFSCKIMFLDFVLLAIVAIELTCVVLFGIIFLLLSRTDGIAKPQFDLHKDRQAGWAFIVSITVYTIAVIAAGVNALSDRRLRRWSVQRGTMIDSSEFRVFQYKLESKQKRRKPLPHEMWTTCECHKMKLSGTQCLDHTPSCVHHSEVPDDRDDGHNYGSTSGMEQNAARDHQNKSDSQTNKKGNYRAKGNEKQNAECVSGNTENGPHTEQHGSQNTANDTENDKVGVSEYMEGRTQNTEDKQQSIAGQDIPQNETGTRQNASTTEVRQRGTNDSQRTLRSSGGDSGNRVGQSEDDVNENAKNDSGRGNQPGQNGGPPDQTPAQDYQPGKETSDCTDFENNDCITIKNGGVVQVDSRKCNVQKVVGSSSALEGPAMNRELFDNPNEDETDKPTQDSNRIQNESSLPAENGIQNNNAYHRDIGAQPSSSNENTTPVSDNIHQISSSRHEMQGSSLDLIPPKTEEGLQNNEENSSSKQANDAENKIADEGTNEKKNYENEYETVDDIHLSLAHRKVHFSTSSVDTTLSVRLFNPTAPSTQLSKGRSEVKSLDYNPRKERSSDRKLSSEGKSTGKSTIKKTSFTLSGSSAKHHDVVYDNASSVADGGSVESKVGKNKQKKSGDREYREFTPDADSSHDMQKKKKKKTKLCCGS